MHEIHVIRYKMTIWLVETVFPKQTCKVILFEAREKLSPAAKSCKIEFTTICCRTMLKSEFFWILRCQIQVDQDRAAINNYFKLRRFRCSLPHVWMSVVAWDFCANGIFHGDGISWFSWKIAILVKSREQQIWLTKSISGGLSTSKSRGVLALRAMFKISASSRVLMFACNTLVRNSFFHD